MKNKEYHDTMQSLIEKGLVKRAIINGEDDYELTDVGKMFLPHVMESFKFEN